MEAYQWQRELYSIWQQHNYIGVCRVSTGGGKTLAGILCIQQYKDDHPFDKIIVVTPSSKLNGMWESELKKALIQDVDVYTYQTAVNRMLRNGLKCNCMICDECHRLASPVQGRVLEMGPRAVLGLSATPEGAVDILGKPMIDIDVNQANLCDFTVHCTSFPISAKEQSEYDNITKRMRKRASEVTGGMATSLPPGRDSYGWNSYDALIRKRRDLCFKMDSRIPYTVALVKKHIRTNIVIYVERRESIQKLKSALLDEGIQSVDDSDVSAFENNSVNVLILCGRMREGWSKNDVGTVILSSINTRVIRNVQTIGRALRIDPNNPDKMAHIYLLMARGTSDENVIKSIGSYYRGHMKVSTIEQELGLGRL